MEAIGLGAWGFGSALCSNLIEISQADSTNRASEAAQASMGLESAGAFSVAQRIGGVLNLGSCQGSRRKVHLLKLTANPGRCQIP